MIYVTVHWRTYYYVCAIKGGTDLRKSFYWSGKNNEIYLAGTMCLFINRQISRAVAMRAD